MHSLKNSELKIYVGNTIVYIFSVLALFSSIVVSAQGTLIYFNDFEDSTGTAWSSSTTYSFNGSTTLGPYGPQSVYLELSNLPINDTVEITFDLYIHDSWDGSSDKWELKFEQNSTIQGSFLTDFNNHYGFHSYPDEYPASNTAKSGAVQVNLPRRCISSTSSSSWSSTKYTLSKRFYSISSVGKFLFHSYQSSNYCDESWGVDNVNIESDNILSYNYRDTVICPGDSVVLSSELMLQSGCLMDISYTGIPYGDPITGFTYKGIYNGHYYYVCNTPTSWLQGERLCRKNGGYLVCIDDANENTYVSNLVPSFSNRNIWIGLFRDPISCQFRWLNCINIAFTNWRSNEPNNGPCGEPYAQIIRGCSYGLNTWNNLGNNSTNGACYSNMVPVLEIDPTIASQASILWSTGDTTESIEIAPSTTTTYWVKKTLNNEITIDTIVVGVLDPTITTSSTVICSGDTIDLNTSDSSVALISGNIQNIWSTGEVTSSISVFPTQKTTYWIAKTFNSITCVDSVTIDVQESFASFDTITACGSYTWIDGTTYTSSTTTPTHLLSTAAGCDSLVTLDLTINYSATGVDTITACDSYTWIDGTTYTSSTTTPTHLLFTAAGCDSLVTLDLTINYSATGVDTITACDSYTWIDGTTYTSSTTTPTHLLSTAAGCDSLVTLDLTINYSATGIVSDTSQLIYYWDATSNNYISSGSYFFYGLTHKDCDSTIQLNLTIIPSNTFYIANTFTPNNDGTNDTFFPVFNNAQTIIFTIYDRWGNRIFQTSDTSSEGWDGYLKETVSPQSTYTWYVHLVYLNGEEIEKTGVVNLIR